MKISQSGINLIRQFEGVKQTAYQDVVGVWTIGVGHTGPEVHRSLVWTDEQINAALESDVGTAEKAINSHFPNISQNQFDALVSLVFNIGVGAFLKSTLFNLLSLGDVKGAGLQFLRWNRAGGQPVIGLHRRREAELALFSS